MENRKFTSGLVLLVTGLLASTMSSFLDDFAIFRNATNFMRGFFDGFALVAFCAAIFVLVRSKQK